MVRPRVEDSLKDSLKVRSKDFHLELQKEHCLGCSKTEGVALGKAEGLLLLEGLAEGASLGSGDELGL
jgi:hypothetical protein